jgi:hypothetical protein
MPAGAHGNGSLLYQVPGLLLFDLKGPQVCIDPDLELALEPIWHSPRVPADATSAIGELARGQDLS